MTSLAIDTHLDDDAWAEHLDNPGAVQIGDITRIGIRDAGMASGQPAVAVLIRCHDGTEVIAQTSWSFLATAMRVLAASPNNTATAAPLTGSTR